MPPSPATWSDWMALAKDIVLAGVPVATVWIAYKGLGKWRQELRGKAHFEAARNLIRATYKLRECIHDARSPLVRAHEFPHGYDTLHGTPAPADDAQAWGHVYANRMRPVWQALEEFDAQTLEAEALWGDAVRSKADALRARLRELSTAIEAVLEDKASGGQDFTNDRQLGINMRGIVSATRGDATNPFNQRLAGALQDIEDVLRPHLKQPGT